MSRKDWPSDVLRCAGKEAFRDDFVADTVCGKIEKPALYRYTCAAGVLLNV